MGNHVLVGLHRFLHRTAVTVAVMGFLTPAVRAESLAYLFNHPWPTNDDFADAIEIIGTNAVVYGHNVGATVQEGEPYHRGVPNDEDGSESVWWRWTAPSDGLLSLSTAGSSFDTFLAVYTGAELEGLEQVARGKSAGRADWSQARVPVLAGTTYQIAVARDFFWGTGKVRLALEFGPSPGPPQNDAFANATELFVSNQTFVASLGGATLEPHEYRNPIAAFEVASAWWRWTPPTNGVLTLLTVEATGEFDWALYSGTSETGLTEIARAYTDHGFAVPVNAGTEYRLAATDGTPWPADTEVELRFSPGGGSPSNDPFYGAIPLTGTNVEISGDFFGSTLELGEQAHPDSEDGVCSLWYSWTPPSDGFASIRLLDGLAGFAIYAGASVSNLSSVAGLGDPEDLADGLVFPVFATTNYLIAAIGESQTHAFRSRVTHQPATIPPENDNFEAATLIPGVSLQEWRHNGGATQESGEPTHRYDGERSVWWRWTAPSDGIATVAVVSNSMDVGLAVYSGSSLWQLASTGVAGASADDFDSEPARVTFRANAGTTYRIAVAGDDGEEGVFGLELDFRDDITVPPANDAIANAIQIVGNDAEIFAHNVGATKQSGEPNPTDDGAAQSSVWWWWVAPADGFVTLSTDGSTFRAGLAVYAGASVTSANRQSSDSGSGPGGSAVLTTRVVGGQQYRIVVDGEEGQGFLRLALYFTEGVPISPPNDDFDVAFNLHGEDIATWGTTAGATRETGEPLHGGEWADARDSIWWRWTAPSNGILRLSVQGEELKPLLAIYTGSNLASLLGVASGYDDDLGTELRRTIQVVAGREYRICVAGYDETASVIRLGLAFDADLATPPNDAFADAAILSENTAEVFGSTFGATKEPGETNHIDQLWTGSSRSLWWTWTATADGFLSITVNGWATQPQLAAYTGDSVTNVTRVEVLPLNVYPQSGNILFPVTAGSEYHIAVAGGSPDWFRLSSHYIDPGPPANDDFENAVPLGGAQTNAWGSCTGATAESGEPYFGDDTNSVWWAWTAPADGQLMVDCLDGSVWVNALVLSGDALSNLVYEPFEILDWGTGTLLGQVLAGHQYYIRVASYGRGGAVRLALEFFPESLYDFWSTQTFPGNAPAELRQPGADPDADGRPNGVELALGTDPMFGNWGGVPTLKNDVGIASVTFARSAMLAEGVTLMLEHSTTLQPDSWSAVATYLPATGWHADLAGAMVQETGSGDVKQVEVFLPQTLANQSRSFYRIRTDQR